jgi:hypothetical protein
MAILLYFEKVREDEAEVEYAFGYPEKNRNMVVEKNSEQARPLDNRQDHSYTAILVAIMRDRDGETWPQSGVFAA